MAGDLSARLRRIRESSRTDGPARQGDGPRSAVAPAPRRAGGADFASAGWMEAAPLVLKRSLSAPVEGMPDSFDPGLAILCPSARRAFADGRPVDAERILLFDLETTGLSGGAGTVAFLAAFGRFSLSAAERVLRIDQYLLLDYPGESEFLDFVVAEFAGGGGGEGVLGSYNGRSFDMQILRTRCVMNGIVPPDPAHLDLVHAARRLWRGRLPSCSLADVERGVLGLDRGDDLGGEEAPDAWFDFLKAGDASRLLAIGDHNRRDLEGLAALLARMDAVGRDPAGAAARGEADPEGLASRWLAAARTARREGGRGDEETARTLLELAAEAGSARSAVSLALELAREGHAERAAEIRRRTVDAAGKDIPAGLLASLCLSLAADALRRLSDREGALRWIDRGLASEGLSGSMRERLRRRRARLAGSGPGVGELPSA